MRVALTSRSPRDERGVAMVVVAMLVVLCATVSMVVASSAMFGTQQTVADRSRLQALSAAEAGRDATLAALGTDLSGCHTLPYTGTLPAGTSRETYSASVYVQPDPSAARTSEPPDALSSTAQLGCALPVGNEHGWLAIKSIGKAVGDKATEPMATKTIVAWYEYTATLPPPVLVPAPEPTPVGALADGGIIEGGDNALDLTSPYIHNGDAVLNSTGMIDCNNATVFQGDLVLPRGGISLSNTCHITGDLVAYGDVNILNTTNAVGGDVISTHGSVSIEGAQVNGSVKAYGGVTLNNSVTIGGDVIAEGNGSVPSKFSGSSSSTMRIGGSVSIGSGGLSQLDLARITGSVNVSATTVTKIGSVVPVTASAINLAGTCSPCAVGTGTQVTQGTSVAAPTFPAPPQMSLPTWADYPFVANDWTDSTYQYQVIAAKDLVPTDKGNGCNYQGDSALINKVDSLTTNTVIDARACPNSAMQFYGVSFSLNASVTFIGPGFSAQTLQVTSADGKDHYFNLITPDDTPDGKPTCSGVTSTITAATMDGHISGIAYTPCELDWGSAGSATTQWRGQLMSGNPKFSGSAPKGQTTASDVYYSSIGLPGGNTSYPPTIAAPPAPPPQYVPSIDLPTPTMSVRLSAQSEMGGS